MIINLYKPNQICLAFVNSKNGKKLLYIKGTHDVRYINIPEFLNIDFKKEIIKVEGSEKYFLQINEFSIHLKNVMRQTTIRFTRRLFLKGVGFKFFINHKNNSLIIAAGFSHLKGIRLPKTTMPEIRNEKNTMLKLTDTNNLFVSQTAKEIQMLKYPDSYKGKGIHLQGLTLIAKEGKKQK